MSVPDVFLDAPERRPGCLSALLAGMVLVLAPAAAVGFVVAAWTTWGLSDAVAAACWVGAAVSLVAGLWSTWRPQVLDERPRR